MALAKGALFVKDFFVETAVSLNTIYKVSKSDRRTQKKKRFFFLKAKHSLWINKSFWRHSL